MFGSCLSEPRNKDEEDARVKKFHRRQREDNKESKDCFLFVAPTQHNVLSVTARAGWDSPYHFHERTGTVFSLKSTLVFIYYSFNMLTLIFIC